MKKNLPGIMSLLLIAGIIIAAHAEVATLRMQNGSGLFGSTYSGAEDSYLREAYPDASTGKWGDIYLGYDNYGSGGRARILIRFDISMLKDGWVTATQVNAIRVKLHLSASTSKAFTNKTVNFYRVSAANKSWSAGSSTSRTTAELGACCWNYSVYDNTFQPAGHACYSGPNPNVDCARHQPWAGSSGCGTSATDYVATLLGSALVSSTDVNGWVTLSTTNTSFINDWINNDNNNAGFLITCPELESGTLSANSGMKFASSENATATIRPVFELDVDNFSTATLGSINYNLASPGKVSMNITNSAGRVVKELLFTADRTAGMNLEFWNCKDDPANKLDSAEVMPDGQYVVKGLVSAGLRAEYLFAFGVGTSDGPFNQPWPGTHGPAASLVIDTSGIFIGAGCQEGSPYLVKNRPDGSRIWTADETYNFDGIKSMAICGDSLYALDIEGKVKLLSVTTKMNGSSCIRYNIAGVTDLAARKGKLVAVTANSLLWINRTNGTASSSVSLSNVGGVAMDTAANALVIVGNQVQKFSQGSSTPQTIISSGLDQPYRLDVNPANNELYVYCKGLSQQVKRFSAAGALLQTYGQAGGRPVQGAYNASIGFLDVSDIAVATDGSFWITEPLRAPRRTTHFAKDGSLVKEFYGGFSYADHGSIDPADPSIIWLESLDGGADPVVEWGANSQLLRIRINWVNKSYTVLGTYSPVFPPMVKSMRLENGRFHVQKYNGKTYLLRDQDPQVLYFDEALDRLRPISLAGCALREGGNWQIPDSLRPLPGEITGYAEWIGRTMYGWWDKNDDGMRQKSEMIFSQHTSLWKNNITELQPSYVAGGWVCPDFTYGGMIKQWEDDRPVKYNSASLLKATMMTSNAGLKIPLFDYTKRDTSFARITVANGDSLNFTDYKSSKYTAVDPVNGDVFSLTQSEYCGEGQGGACFGVSPGSDFGGDRLGKWDSLGNLKWVVGRHANTASPNPGEMFSIMRPLGVVHGCAAYDDLRGFTYVYNEDGLYVGDLLRTISNGPDQPLLGSETVPLCGEQFGGSLVQITTGAVPGLTPGDVIFLAAGHNASLVYRITGWESFKRFQTTLTVTGGKITAQGPVRAEHPALSYGTRDQMAAMTINTTQHNPVITYTVPSRSVVALELYTALGRKVATVVDKVMEAGTYSVSVGEKELGVRGTMTTGFYIVRLAAGSHRVTKQMMVVR